MAIKQFFKISAVAGALVLAGCGGDININEGDVTNQTGTDTTPDPAPGEGTDNALIEAGLATDVSASFPEITDKPVYQLNANTEFNDDATLSADAHWVLNGRTAVGGDNENSAVLTIEAGTTLIGQAGEDFLVVRRGSQIMANGTAEAPIVMT